MLRNITNTLPSSNHRPRRMMSPKVLGPAFTSPLQEKENLSKGKGSFSRPSKQIRSENLLKSTVNKLLQKKVIVMAERPMKLNSPAVSHRMTRSQAKDDSLNSSCLSEFSEKSFTSVKLPFHRRNRNLNVSLDSIVLFSSTPTTTSSSVSSTSTHVSHQKLFGRVKRKLEVSAEAEALDALIMSSGNEEDAENIDTSDSIRNNDYNVPFKKKRKISNASLGSIARESASVCDISADSSFTFIAPVRPFKKKLRRKRSANNSLGSVTMESAVDDLAVDLSSESITTGSTSVCDISADSSVTFIAPERPFKGSLRKRRSANNSLGSVITENAVDDVIDSPVATHSKAKMFRKEKSSETLSCISYTSSASDVSVTESSHDVKKYVECDSDGENGQARPFSNPSTCNKSTPQLSNDIAANVSNSSVSTRSKAKMFRKKRSSETLSCISYTLSASDVSVNESSHDAEKSVECVSDSENLQTRPFSNPSTCNKSTPQLSFTCSQNLSRVEEEKSASRKRDQSIRRGKQDDSVIQDAQSPSTRQLSEDPGANVSNTSVSTRSKAKMFRKQVASETLSCISYASPASDVSLSKSSHDVEKSAECDSDGENGHARRFSNPLTGKKSTPQLSNDLAAVSTRGKSKMFRKKRSSETLPCISYASASDVSVNENSHDAEKSVECGSDGENGLARPFSNILTCNNSTPQLSFTCSQDASISLRSNSSKNSRNGQDVLRDTQSEKSVGKNVSCRSQVPAIRKKSGPFKAREETCNTLPEISLTETLGVESISDSKTSNQSSISSEEGESSLEKSSDESRKDSTLKDKSADHETDSSAEADESISMEERESCDEEETSASRKLDQSIRSSGKQDDSANANNDSSLRSRKEGKSNASDFLPNCSDMEPIHAVEGPVTPVIITDALSCSSHDELSCSEDAPHSSSADSFASHCIDQNSLLDLTVLKKKTSTQEADAKIAKIIEEAKQMANFKSGMFRMRLPVPVDPRPAPRPKTSAKKPYRSRVKLYKPGYWANKQLYNHLTKKLEAEFQMERVRKAEEVVGILNSAMLKIGKSNDYHKSTIDAVKMELAKLKIIVTTDDFYKFVRDFLPLQFADKVIPSQRPFTGIIWPPKDNIKVTDPILN